MHVTSDGHHTRLCVSIQATTALLAPCCLKLSAAFVLSWTPGPPTRPHGYTSRAVSQRGQECQERLAKKGGRPRLQSLQDSKTPILLLYDICIFTTFIFIFIFILTYMFIFVFKCFSLTSAQA